MKKLLLIVMMMFAMSGCVMTPYGPMSTSEVYDVIGYGGYNRTYVEPYPVYVPTPVYTPRYYKPKTVVTPVPVYTPTPVYKPKTVVTPTHPHTHPQPVKVDKNLHKDNH